MPGPVTGRQSSESVPAKYIVILNDAVQPDDVPMVAGRVVEAATAGLPSLRLKRREAQGELFLHALRGFAVHVSAKDGERISQLQADPDVAFVAEDRQVRIHSQLFQPGMQRIRARRHGQAKINDIRDTDLDVDIAILDTGIDSTHPDLNVYRSVSFVPGDLTQADPHGHGTHVAGIAAAIDDDSGVHGVAPGARLWAVKVVGQDGTGDISDVIAGLDYVMANAAEIDVVNLSLGGPGIGDDGNCGATLGDPLHQAICNVVEAGVVVVVSSGNFEPYGRDASLVSPACYDEVITVSAVVETDGLGPAGGQGAATVYGADNSFARTFSNYGWDVDLAAPGVEVLSTWPDGGYTTETGTSAAAPHVAGAAALWIAGHDKPVDRDEVAHVRDELVRLAFPQRGPDEGFSGDRETYAEPLLNVAALDPVVFDPVDPELRTSQAVYEYGVDSEAVVSVYLRGQDGSPLEGIPGNGMLAYLDGQSREVQFEARGQGEYSLTLSIDGLLPGDHAFTAVIRNVAGFERSGGCRIVVRSPMPRILIHEFAFGWPVMNPGSFFSFNPLHAALMDGRGAPLVVSPEEFQTTFSGGGPELAWTLPQPDLLTGLSPGVTYGVYRAEVRDVHTLPLGTYHAELTVSRLGLSDSATAAFDVAYPDPLLLADLTAGFTTYDFTQTIEPPATTLKVEVSNEWATGVSGLYYLLAEPLTLSIDGQVVAGVGFTEDFYSPGLYVAEEVQIDALPHGPHELVVQVTDSRGIQADSNPVTIEIVRETTSCSNPLAAGTQSDLDGDGIRDECDNCPAVSNRSQRMTSAGDADEAGLGNACRYLPGLRVSPDAADDPDFFSLQDAVDGAVDTARSVRIEILPGSQPYTGGVVVDRGQSFRFVGRDLGSGPPVVEPGVTGSAAFDLRSAGDEPLVIRNLVIRGQGIAADQRGISTESSVTTRLSDLRFEEIGTGVRLQGGSHRVERVAMDGSVETGVFVDGAALTLSHGEFNGLAEAVTIVGPSAVAEIGHVLVDGGGSGSGVVNDSSASSRLNLRHSTLVHCGTAVRGNDVTTIAHSILWNNLADAAGVACGGIGWSDVQDLDCGGTNRSLDPLFDDPLAGNYRLQPGSPLLEHGPDPGQFTGEPCSDLDGGPRLLDHDGDGLARVDPGAFERENPALTPHAIDGLAWTGRTTLAWSSDPAAVEYYVYRGLLSSLAYSDFGVCEDGLSIVHVEAALTDAGIPPSGDGFYYRITVEDAAGEESSLGNGTCAERSNPGACP